jgi:GNAT superfamily N-acetyltransferase
MSDASPSTVSTRDAGLSDNQALIALTAACPMRGDVGLLSNRAPDFFALNRLEGETWRVGVVDAPGGGVAGAVAVAERQVYIDGKPARIGYAGDMKVHPDHRGGPVADALSEYVLESVRAIGGDAMPILLTILAGNRPMERRQEGPRGMPRLERFATIRAHSVSFMWRRKPPRGVDVVITRALAKDLEEMAALWTRVAPGRQLAPIFDAATFRSWIAASPGLDISKYFLARRRDGSLAGFFALWDQESFKQMVVTTYSLRLKIFRAIFNLFAPLMGATRLPPAGAQMRYLTAVNVCVAPEDAGVLRALVIHAYNEYRGKRYAFFTLGLDVKDPLSKALDGLMSQPMDIGAYVTMPSRKYTGPSLDGRPLHYEIALV